MRHLVLFVTALITIGCATAYQHTGFTGGFTEAQLGENIFQVSFSGNGHTSGKRAADFALLRSSEVAIENGFRYFFIADSEKDSSISTHTSPTESYTSGSVYGNAGMVSGFSTTTTRHGKTSATRKFVVTNIIICFKEKPETANLVLDAELTKMSLRKSYGIVD